MFCGQTAELRVACVVLHRGEEPPIVGTGGTAAVFLTGCSLRCVFCQNHQISHERLGRTVSASDVAEQVMQVHARGADTVSFVTPDHFVPHMSSVASILRLGGVVAPVVVNCSGYQSPEALALMEPWADVYLADFKFAEKALATSLADCEDYVDVALEALTEMVQQKGFLQMDERGVASRGVLVRHLVLPGLVENSVRALRMLAAEFGVRLPLSLMSQYVPACSRLPDGLDREVLPEEFAQVWQEAASLGFELIYIQPPGELRDRDRLPDFAKASPFPASLSLS